MSEFQNWDTASPSAWEVFISIIYKFYKWKQSCSLTSDKYHKDNRNTLLTSLKKRTYFINTEYFYGLTFYNIQIDKSPEGQFTQLMTLPRTLQQKITSLVGPPGKNRDVEEILLQVAHDPDCGLVVHQGKPRSASIISLKTL